MIYTVFHKKWNRFIFDYNSRTVTEFSGLIFKTCPRVTLSWRRLIQLAQNHLVSIRSAFSLRSQGFLNVIIRVAHCTGNIGSEKISSVNLIAKQRTQWWKRHYSKTWQQWIITMERVRICPTASIGINILAVGIEASSAGFVRCGQPARLGDIS